MKCQNPNLIFLNISGTEEQTESNMPLSKEITQNMLVRVTVLVHCYLPHNVLSACELYAKCFILL